MASVAFPYPVIGRSDDYLESDFQVAVRDPVLVKDREDSEEVIRIEYQFHLSELTINEKIDAGYASFGFEIVCTQTALRTVHLTGPTGVLDLDPRQVYSEVELLPRIFVLKEIDQYSSTNLHPEFSQGEFSFKPGDFMGIGEDKKFYVDFQTLSFHRLLKVDLNRERDPFSYGFQLDSNTLTISMGPSMFEAWTRLRVSPESKPLLIMSVYKDCFVAALDFLIREKDVAAERWWARALDRLLVERGIELPENPDFLDLNIIAQKLVEDLGVKKVGALWL